MNYNQFYVDVLEHYGILDMYVTMCRENPVDNSIKQMYDWKNYQSLLDAFPNGYQYDKREKTFFHEPIEIVGNVLCKFKHHLAFDYNLLSSWFGLRIDDKFVTTNWRFLLEKYRPEFYENSENNAPAVYEVKTTKLLLLTFFSWQRIIEKELRLLADGYYEDKYSPEA